MNTEPTNENYECAISYCDGDREWQEVWHVGEYRIEAIFAVHQGVEIPWAVRVDVTGPNILLRLAGRNLLAQAFTIAEALNSHPIRE